VLDVKDIRVTLGILLLSPFPIPYCTHVPIYMYIVPMGLKFNTSVIHYDDASNIARARVH
jgi:hypothetical protein